MSTSFKEKSTEVLAWQCRLPSSYYIGQKIFFLKYFQVRSASDHGGVSDGRVCHVCPVHCRGYHSGLTRWWFIYSALLSRHSAVIAVVTGCNVLFICKLHLQACMAGIVFAKFTKPANRAETLLFSKNALISMRNGSFYLLCRIADLR